jgi:trans-aconitate 2-methyltransferase
MLWNPEDYAQNSNAQLKWARELRANLNLQGNEAVLDVGCGDGKITADFATALPQGRILGTDSSVEMVEYAARNYQADNLAFAAIDARSLEFDREFDLVFSNATLHWVDDHRSMLKGVSRALRPGGRLVISCGGQGNAIDVLAVMAEVTASPQWQEYFGDFQNPYFFYGDQEYAQWLPAAGLEPENLQLVPKDMTHLGPEGLAGWIRTTWMPFTHCVPKGEREHFIADFVSRYLEVVPMDDQGQTHVSMVRLEVSAHKPWEIL